MLGNKHLRHFRL